ncbi:DMT family transporter [Neobacillus sp. SuZ13]|uniref:DMT family transporter n=1 Tax=Neobacillus sp. SuZ13 TaxID=3047875 RepID=UPI0024BF3594|nr:DMT family transporter [Neobacillus sp. SuZ13]WHY69572.1 DMT family transporter [Neobacillus sp. SuZ13]
MKMSKLMANILLLITSVFWGSGFVVTKIALDVNVSAGFINFVRGFLFVVCVLLVFHKKIFKMTFRDFKVGVIAGLLNFGGFITQTIGVMYTTPSNNAFISASYVVIIPFIAWIFYGKKFQGKSLIAISACILGMAIISGITNEEINMNIGDVYTLFCAFFYAGSIVYLGYSTRTTDFSIVAFLLAAVQAIGGLLFFLLVEKGQLSNINWSVAIVPLLYMGVVCSFVGQTVQVLAQKHTSATSAGLIMMLESVFGSIFSITFGFEPFTMKLVLGGTIILLSIILMELEFKQFLFKNKETGKNKLYSGR